MVASSLSRLSLMLHAFQWVVAVFLLPVRCAPPMRTDRLPVNGADYDACETAARFLYHAIIAVSARSVTTHFQTSTLRQFGIATDNGADNDKPVHG